MSTPIDHHEPVRNLFADVPKKRSSKSTESKRRHSEPIYQSTLTSSEMIEGTAKDEEKREKEALKDLLSITKKSWEKENSSSKNAKKIKDEKLVICGSEYESALDNLEKKKSLPTIFEAD